jgi:hypothetical protein
MQSGTEGIRYLFIIYYKDDLEQIIAKRNDIFKKVK